MLSLSASLTLNRVESATVVPKPRVRLEVVTTGGVLGGGETVKGDQKALSSALQAWPSKARICRLVGTVPMTKANWESWPAVNSIRPAGWAWLLIVI